MKNTDNESQLMVQLADGLGAVAAYLEPQDAAHAAAALTQAMQVTRDSYILSQFMNVLCTVAARLEPSDAMQAVATFFEAWAKRRGPHMPGELATKLSAVLTEHSPASQRQRGVEASAAVGVAASQPFAALAFLPGASEPLPCRFTDQQLVELLKLPTCIREAGRVVLNHLGNRHRRHFIDHWELVRFAKEQQLGLDFTSPPVRP
jgi:hypothetical protein